MKLKVLIGNDMKQHENESGEAGEANEKLNLDTIVSFCSEH